MTTPKRDRHEEEARLSLGHLSGTQREIDEDDEDWGEMPSKKNDDDLERELASSSGKSVEEDFEEEEGEEMATATAARETPVPMMPPMAVGDMNLEEEISRIQQLQSNLPAVLKAFDAKLENIDERRKKLDEEEKAVRSQINFFRVLSGQAPLSEKEEEEEAPKPRRGRRGRRRAFDDFENEDKPKAESEEEEAPRTRGGRGKRFKNKETLKEAILRAMKGMRHPETGEQNTGVVKEITNRVLAQGYKTTSDKPTNTVRIQMYRLVEEKMVKQDMEDNSFSLTEKALKWLETHPNPVGDEE